MTTTAVRLHLPEEGATDRLGAALAATAPGVAVVHLRGDLGAGKSTLARAWLRALGVEGAIRSPTYTLVERYPLAGGGEALHLDLYRIGDPGELEFLGLDGTGLEGRDVVLWLVEWPERGARALPAADLVVALAIEGAGRSVELEPGSAMGEAWIERLVQEVQLQDLPASM